MDNPKTGAESLGHRGKGRVLGKRRICRKEEAGRRGTVKSGLSAYPFSS